MNTTFLHRRRTCSVMRDKYIPHSITAQHHPTPITIPYHKTSHNSIQHTIPHFTTHHTTHRTQYTKSPHTTHNKTAFHNQLSRNFTSTLAGQLCATKLGIWIAGTRRSNFRTTRADWSALCCVFVALPSFYAYTGYHTLDSKITIMYKK